MHHHYQKTAALIYIDEGVLVVVLTTAIHTHRVQPCLKCGLSIHARVFCCYIVSFPGRVIDGGGLQWMKPLDRVGKSSHEYRCVFCKVFFYKRHDISCPERNLI